MKKYVSIAYTLLFMGPIIVVATAVILAKHKGVVYHSTDPARLKLKWNAESFSSIEDTRAFANQIRVQVLSVTSNCVSLTGEQKEKLVGSIDLFLLAYHTGKYKDYEQFRFPIRRGHFDANRVAEFMTKLAAIPQYCSGLNTNDVRAVVKTMWETYGIIGKVYCTTCWEGVAVSSITVDNVTSVSEAAIPNVTQKVITNENIGGSVTIQPLFKFKPSEADIVKEYGSVITATVSLVVRENPKSSYPVYIQYYWSERDHTWLPHNIALAYWNQKQLFMF